MNIVDDDLSHPAVKALLAEHMRGMVKHCPPGSIHSLDLDGLRSPDVSFWTAWFDQELLGSSFAGRSTNMDPIHPAAL
jgi:putative acetyltransferase